ncbi:MAG: YceI family protein [Streptomyces sp.]|uniref:YceI family protein n=1 Tax=Streptomyces sp. TaxID=1931 RepID=UPI003D6B29E5
MDAKRDQVTNAPRLGRYTIDAANSTVAFSSRHLFGLMPVRGTFAIRSGTVDVAEPLADSSLRVEIAAASFHTGKEHRDGDVRSAKFLDAGRHPDITFVSTSVEPAAVTGTLTVCGVEKPVSLSIGRADVSPGVFTVRATTRVDRTEFGVTAARGLAGRYLDLSLEVTCVHR